MYDLFTDELRKAMDFANRSGLALRHEYIGTEHILEGIVNCGSVPISELFVARKITGAQIIGKIRSLVQPGPDATLPVVAAAVLGIEPPPANPKLPQTPRAKKVIEYAIEISRGFEVNYVGLEHMLLACLQEKDGVAAIVLNELGFTLDETRNYFLAKKNGFHPEGEPMMREIGHRTIVLEAGRAGIREDIDPKALLLQALSGWIDEYGVRSVILVGKPDHS